MCFFTFQTVGSGPLTQNRLISSLQPIRCYFRCVSWIFQKIGCGPLTQNPLISSLYRSTFHLNLFAESFFVYFFFQDAPTLIWLIIWLWKYQASRVSFLMRSVISKRSKPHFDPGSSKWYNFQNANRPKDPETKVGFGEHVTVWKVLALMTHIIWLIISWLKWP